MSRFQDRSPRLVAPAIKTEVGKSRERPARRVEWRCALVVQNCLEPFVRERRKRAERAGAHRLVIAALRDAVGASG